MKLSRTFFLYNHQRKGDAFVNAMVRGGFQRRMAANASLVFMDVDTRGRINALESRIKSGAARIFCYPHSARPFLGWDGFYHKSDLVSATFLFTDGQIDVQRAYGSTGDIHSVGWAYSPLLPFTPVSNPKKILFAPMHPNKNGAIPKVHQSVNAETFKVLLDVVEKTGMTLSVRYIGELSRNGLWADERVTYIEGETNTQQIKETMEADVIVSHETHAYIAVALGKPVIMMGEWHAPAGFTVDGREQAVKSWDKYKDLLMYPLDILDTGDPHKLILEACSSDEKIKDWRRRIIGDKPFDARLFTKIVESYIK